MGENARFKNGHMHFKNASVSKKCRRLLWAWVGSVSALACRKNAFKHSYTVECGNRLHVGVRAKNASVSGLRVGPSKMSFRICFLSNPSPDNSGTVVRNSEKGAFEKVHVLKCPNRHLIVCLGEVCLKLSCTVQRDTRNCSCDTPV